MEQKTINKNKLITILCAVALTLGVLVSAVLFSMPPVHAADQWILSSNSGSYDVVVKYYNPDKKLHVTETYTTNSEFFGNSNYFYGAVVEKNDSFFGFKVFYYDLTTHEFHNPVFSDSVTLTQIFTDDNGAIKQTGSLQYNSLNIGIYLSIDSYETDLPCFGSLDSFKNYCLSGDNSGMINKPEVPDLTDESYTFIGFSINGKIARWTGTTERSHLKDQDVEEYTLITYAWATTTEPDNIGSFQEYDGEFSTSAKQLKLPWPDMESGKVDFQFIRQVNVIPCYRIPGSFYHGQGVKVFFNSDGTVDKIEQATIPTDSETIGNDISLIGFRYDNSFHAEWVDVWSNAVNKSAFDLDSGGQYLSLGIKAIYYDGSKVDIDFYSLDRKKLTWDKAFSDFKENNGSPIKSLYFTPYTKTGVNNPWNKGNSIVVNFDENGNASSSFDTGDDGTVHLDDFKLTGVVWNKPVVQSGTITWTGTTPNSDLLFIPDSDTLVVATYPRYDSDMNTSYETWSTTTIGKGSMKVNVDYLIDYYKNSELAWNGEIWLTPCYKKGGVLYMGEPVIINCLKGTVSDIVVDKDSGKAEQVDKTDQNKSDADSILNVGNQFYSIINGLIGSLQQLPALLTAIFGFLPSSFTYLIYASFAVIIICRILGR